MVVCQYLMAQNCLSPVARVCIVSKSLCPWGAAHEDKAWPYPIEN